MKIPHQLPQFDDNKTLVVVMGSHHGILYIADEGTISKIEEVRIDVPEYSDNEGMFRRGAGSGISYGSVLELKKDEAQKDFSKTMAEKIGDSMKTAGIDRIYLYAPSEMKSLIDTSWGNDMKNLIVQRFDGNYVFKTPIKLLEMINKE